jgi:prolyl-tRNA editing enzyme YbaK/EbsC (Cys-tRNA(Pro) deacylase)
VLSPSAQKVQNALRERGFGELRIVEMPTSTRTAQEAASAVGCSVGQIVKSLIFRGAESGKPYLFLVSGANRVDEAKVGERLGERLERAKPEWVREVSGFAIGGVPPVGHTMPMEAFIDPDLLRYGQVWAAAGTPNALFALDPRQLVTLTRGRVMAVN